MKKIKFLSVALMCGMFMLASCNNEENFGPEGINNEIYKAFEKEFPGAENVQWNSDGTYAIASFNWSGSRAGSSAANTAWFELNSHKFVMDEYDIPYSQLDQRIRDAFESSKYADWKRDEDVDVIRKVENGSSVLYIYVIEVEQGELEYDLYYSEDGILLKEVPNSFGNNEFTDLLPSKPAEAGSVTALVQEMYPGARIVDLDNDGGGVEVEFIYDNLKHEALFSTNNEWINTKIDYNADLSVLPEIARTLINNNHGTTLRELDIEKYVCADSAKDFFNVEVEDAKGWEFEYNFDVNGNEINKPDFSEEIGSGLTVDDAIQAELDKRYPGAVVVERDYDDGMLEIEIRHEGVEKKVYFNAQNAWLFTEYDVLAKDLLPAITDYINKNYSGYRIEDAEATEDANGITYEVEVENRSEYKLYFDQDGNFIKAVRD